jgi:hypothetical protein
MTNRCRAADDTTASIHRKEHDVAALAAMALAAMALAPVVVLRMRKMKIPSCVVLNMTKPNILFILICFK